VDDDVAAGNVIDRLLPERLWRMQRVTGLPVAFGGPAQAAAGGRQIVLTRLSGTLGGSLRGLTVGTGRGLGGLVLRERAAQRVRDYASAPAITHEFDGIVAGEERLTSVLAVPVTVNGTVRAVLYGAVREQAPIGDRAVGAAKIVADHLAKDLASLLPDPALPDPALPGPALPDARAALAELADLIAAIGDPELRERLARLHAVLGGSTLASQCHAPAQAVLAAAPLAPREREVLRIAAVGATNVEIAAELGLSPQTVKAYMRAAMRKLGVHNRTAALHAARLANAI
jgi:DNA-binding CsgD family transcriptional regulator